MEVKVRAVVKTKKYTQIGIMWKLIYIYVFRNRFPFLSYGAFNKKNNGSFIVIPVHCIYI